MSQNNRPPVFLERRSYRQRRMMDALRLMPVLGLMLWMRPLFWPNGDTESGVAYSNAMIYVFGVWTLLIVLNVSLWRVLRTRINADIPAEDDQRGA